MTKTNRQMRGWRRLCGLAALTVAIASPGFGQPEGYSPTVRPDPDGVVTRVTLAAFVLDVVGIDDLRQEYTTDFYVAMSWRDPRLAVSETGSGRERIMPLSAIWSPMLGAVNRRDVEAILPEAARVDVEGNVLYTQRLLGDFSSPLDIHDFPFDQQTLELRIASYRYGPDELALELDGDRIGRFENFSIAGWTLGQPMVEAAPLEVLGIRRAGAVFRMRAERDSKYYLLTMVLPLLLIALMAWTVFWIDPSLLPSQVAIATASVFTLIAFRLSLSLKLPKVSYLTTADWFILTTTLLVFAALGETVYAGRLAKMGQEDRARRVDARSRWIYLAALVVVCVLTLT